MDPLTLRIAVVDRLGVGHRAPKESRINGSIVNVSVLTGAHHVLAVGLRSKLKLILNNAVALGRH